MSSAVLGLSLALAFSCGGDEEDNLVSPCNGELAGLCGSSCTTDSGCGAGVHCGAEGRCTAECTPGSKHCGKNQVCDAKGRCQVGIGIGGNGGTGADGGSGEGCIKADVTFDKQTPTVVLLIDQSGSMTASFGGGSRWNVLRNALMNDQTGIVKQLENDVRFGLALYTSFDGNAGGQCPVLTEVSMSLGNHAAIKAVYDAASPEDETPTGESIDAVVQTLAPYPEPGPKVIVLATDGEPDTCAQPNPQNGQPESIAAAQNAFQQGIETYVISVGNQVSLGHLQDVANAGKGLQVGGSQNATYYLANDQAALVAAFNEIIYGVRSCVFELEGQVSAADADQGVVTLDGQPLVHGDPNGWKLNPPNEVELVGSACDAIKSGDHQVSIDFPCGVYVPVR